MTDEEFEAKKQEMREEADHLLMDPETDTPTQADADPTS